MDGTRPLGRTKHRQLAASGDHDSSDSALCFVNTSSCHQDSLSVTTLMSAVPCQDLGPQRHCCTTSALCICSITASTLDFQMAVYYYWLLGAGGQQQQKNCGVKVALA